MTEMMKAALVYGPSEIRVLDVPKPQVGKGEVLARIQICMTSGTTVKQYVRQYPGLDYPYGIGYEWAGQIEEVGEGVDKDLIGKRCTSKWKRTPDDCFFCLRGQPNLCANMKSKGYGDNWSDKPELGIVSGYYKEYVVLPASQADIFPDHLSNEDGCQIPYLTYSQHGNNNVKIDVGDTVAVVGSGAIGLLQMMLSHIRGAQTVAIDPNQSRLDFAKNIGAADYVIKAGNTEDAKKGLEGIGINNGHGPDVVIECVGVPATYEEAIDLVRRGGQVLLFAGCAQGTTITASTYRLHYEEIRIIGSMHASLIDYETSFRLVERGVIKPSIFISGNYQLSDVKNALDAHKNGEGMKFAVVP
jgi:L-iditol 2-dehydrogenase